MTAPTELDETPAEEFSRLVIEYNEGGQNSDEAWNLIADFACEHSDAIIRALRSLPASGAGWRDMELPVRPLTWEADHGVAGMGPYRLFKAETPLGRFVYGTDAEGAAYYHTASSGIMMVGDEATAKRLAESSWIKAAIAEATKYIDPPSAPDRRAGE